MPWLDERMISILESWLQPDDKILEWGAGRSTLWFAERVAFVATVEHDPSWFSKMSAEIQRRSERNIELHLFPEREAYVNAARHYGNEAFDLCLVDGIARGACAVAALDVLKAGGLLVLDNANRYIPHSTRTPFSLPSGASPPTTHWAEFLERTAGWRRVWTSNGVWDGCLWMKPISGSNSRTPRAFLLESLWDKDRSFTAQ